MLWQPRRGMFVRRRNFSRSRETSSICCSLGAREESKEINCEDQYDVQINEVRDPPFNPLINGGCFEEFISAGRSGQVSPPEEKCTTVRMKRRLIVINYCYYRVSNQVSHTRARTRTNTHNTKSVVRVSESLQRHLLEPPRDNELILITITDCQAD